MTLRRRSFIRLGGTATAASATLGLAACSSGGSGGNVEASTKDPDELETTIRILAPSYSESSKSDWEAIIAKFNETYPKVTVELQIEGWEDFASKVQARIQSGDYPDILNDNTFASSADGGILFPITDLLSSETLDAVEPALLECGKGPDGTLWAIPDVASARMLAYNTSLFEQAGLSDAPKTWEDMEAASERIAALGDGSYAYGMPLGPEEAQVEATLWLWGAGGDWQDGEELVVESDAALTAFEEMKTFIDEGWTQPDVGATNRQQCADLWNNGKIGMMLMHTGLLGVTDSDFPDVEYGLGPVPTQDGTEIAYGVTDFILAFNNGDGDRKQATAAFLEVFYSDEMYSAWYKPTGLMPIKTSLIEAAGAEAKHFKPFYDMLSKVKFQPVGLPSWDVLQGALQSTAGSIAGEDPAAVLSEIQSQMDAQA